MKKHLIHCLVVDDDEQIRALLSDFLEQFEMSVTAVDGADAARTAFTGQSVDIVVLDLMLGGENGLSLCKWITDNSDVPVILLTAQGDPVSKVLGLEMGADDYVAKPFEPRELVARIQAIIRRKLRGERTMKVRSTRTTHFAGWQLDRMSRQLTSPEAVVIALSNAEYRLLVAFIEHPGRVLNRDQLIDLTQAVGVVVNDRSIDLCIWRMRQKMSLVSRDADIIKTIRGVGYMFDARVT